MLSPLSLPSSLLFCADYGACKTCTLFYIGHIILIESHKRLLQHSLTGFARTSTPKKKIGLRVSEKMPLRKDEVNAKFAQGTEDPFGLISCPLIHGTEKK